VVERATVDLLISPLREPRTASVHEYAVALESRKIVSRGESICGT
jgi:hypothetical protein